MSADYQTQGDIAVISMNNPPVNGLGLELRRSVCDGVQRAIGDQAIKAIVLTGAGKAFCSGQDLSDPGELQLELHFT